MQARPAPANIYLRFVPDLIQLLLQSSIASARQRDLPAATELAKKANWLLGRSRCLPGLSVEAALQLARCLRLQAMLTKEPSSASTACKALFVRFLCLQNLPFVSAHIYAVYHMILLLDISRPVEMQSIKVKQWWTYAEFLFVHLCTQGSTDLLPPLPLYPLA